MLFSSITFLYYYLPLTLLAYYLTPKKYKNLTLLIMSFLFYGWGEPKYLLIMVFSIINGYLFGRFIEASYAKPFKKVLLFLSIIFNVGILAYFKYMDFFIYNINSVMGLSIPLLNLALPIGISFYQFQIIAYNVDIYRGDVKAQKNIINFGEFVSFFPQLIAGPIVRYSDIVGQIESRKHSFKNIYLGIRRFILGLSKKIFLANLLGELCYIFKHSGDKSLLFYWLYGLSFSLQIYLDFSAYSDMAIGLAKIFAFDIMENFNYPYISKSVTEFWRRWHISLGNWFRDYIYIPLGGNRTSKKRNYFNILLVWLLTGFWHGASWNFIMWGLFYALLLILEKNYLKKHLDNMKILSHLYLILVSILGFILFDANSLREAGQYYLAMFGLSKIPLISTEFIYYLKSYGLIIIFSIIGASPLMKVFLDKVTLNLGTFGKKILTNLEILFMVFFLLLITAYLLDGSFNPFLYFRF